MKPTRLTHKHQPRVRPVALRAMTAPNTGLRGVVGVHFHNHRADKRRFVGQESQQLGELASNRNLVKGACGVRR